MLPLQPLPSLAKPVKTLLSTINKILASFQTSPFCVVLLWLNSCMWCHKKRAGGGAQDFVTDCQAWKFSDHIIGLGVTTQSKEPCVMMLSPAGLLSSVFACF